MKFVTLNVVIKEIWIVLITLIRKDRIMEKHGITQTFITFN